MEDHKYLRIGLVVHSTVISLNRVGALARWVDHVSLSFNVVACQHPTKVHVLLSILIGPGVLVLGGVDGIHCKVRPITITSS